MILAGDSGICNGSEQRDKTMSSNDVGYNEQKGQTNLAKPVHCKQNYFSSPINFSLFLHNSLALLYITVVWSAYRILVSI